MLDHNDDQFVWVEKYRPRTIDDTILPKQLKDEFKGFLKQGNFPNLLLKGSGGVGKTTVARALVEELGADYIIINGSEEGRLIETVRNKIKNFASTMSFGGQRKYVIIDEADYMNAETVQPALRAFTEEFSSNCGFIFTCNFPSRILDLIHSRCHVVDFKIDKKDVPDLAKQFYKRCMDILMAENVKFDKAVLAEVIKKHFPDNRRILNELQGYSASGSIDVGILHKFSDVDIRELMKNIRDKDYQAVRGWVAQNVDSNPVAIFRKIYDNASQYVEKEYIPQLVVIIADYQYKAAFVADHEINVMAMFTEMMVDCKWK